MKPEPEAAGPVRPQVALWTVMNQAARLVQARGVGQAPDARWAEEATACTLASLGEVEGRAVVDVASGRGEPGLALALAGARVVLTDTDRAALELAQRRAEAVGVEVSVRCADAAALPFEDASVDGVTCQWGMDHLEDPDAALVEWVRILRPEGRLVVLTWGRTEGSPLHRALWGDRPGRPRPALAERVARHARVRSARALDLRLRWHGELAPLLERLGGPLPDALRDERLARARSVLDPHLDGEALCVPAPVEVVCAAP